MPEELVAQASDLVARYGYPMVGIYMLAEGLGLPLFSEVFLIFAGYLASTGRFDLLHLIAWATAGSLVGATLSYAIGRSGGRALLWRMAKLTRSGPRRLAGIEDWFARSGPLAILVGRHLSGVRLLLPYVAGAFRMAFAPYLVYTAIGALLWAVATVGAGFWLGRDWPRLVAILHHVGIAVASLAAAVGAFFAWKAYAAKGTAAKREGDD